MIMATTPATLPDFMPNAVERPLMVLLV